MSVLRFSACWSGVAPPSLLMSFCPIWAASSLWRGNIRWSTSLRSLLISSMMLPLSAMSVYFLRKLRMFVLSSTDFVSLISFLSSPKNAPVYRTAADPWFWSILCSVSGPTLIIPRNLAISWAIPACIPDWIVVEDSSDSSFGSSSATEGIFWS